MDYKEAYTHKIDEEHTPIPPTIPERNLIADILYRAIRDVLNVEYKNSKNHRTAKTWMRIHLPLKLEEGHLPFSFFWCCMQLDLDPLELRDIIERMYENGERIPP